MSVDIGWHKRGTGTVCRKAALRVLGTNGTCPLASRYGRDFIAMRESIATRRLFMHPAHGAIGVSSPAAWCACCDWTPPSEACRGVFAWFPRLRRGRFRAHGGRDVGDILRQSLAARGVRPWIHRTRLVRRPGAMRLPGAVASHGARGWAMGMPAPLLPRRRRRGRIGRGRPSQCKLDRVVCEVLGGGVPAGAAPCALVARPVEAARRHPVLSGVGTFAAQGGTGQDRGARRRRGGVAQWHSRRPDGAPGLDALWRWRADFRHHFGRRS